MIDPQARLEELVSKLRARGFRLTPQRRAVLAILASEETHPTVEQIYRCVKEEFPMTSLATVYKTVALLKEMGEVLELSLSDEGKQYDCRRPRPHPHLICVDCGRIVDLRLDELEQTPDEVARSTGYRIVNHRFDFFGICPNCQGAE